jgi:hypothetical protein
VTPASRSARAAIAATPPPRTLRRVDAMAQSWDALRKDARRLETEIDAKLVTYSRLSAALSTFSSRASGFDVARADGTLTCAAAAFAAAWIARARAPDRAMHADLQRFRVLLSSLLSRVL